MTKHAKPARYYKESDCDLTEFRSICEASLPSLDVPLAHAIEKNIPIYHANKIDFDDGTMRRDVMGEWAWNLREGSGIVVIKNAQADHEAIDLASGIFNEILDEEARAGMGAGDHFAKAGANGRIWNSLQKLCQKSPEIFARYHGSPAIDAVAEAWLGPAYQMTAQLNLVRPGGAAQQAHRDYHLGFMTAEQAGQFPAHAHLLSPVLTLQGAIAHLDIGVEAGPTKLLPFSQKYDAGYMAWRREDFRDYFEENYIQLPLEKGDALFFNPAVFHAGGENKTKDVQRLVNLLQVSSAMGRAMESIDRVAMCKAVYPVLREGEFDASVVRSVIAATAEGYAFPTNLDLDPPVGGLAPQTQNQLMHQALEEAWDVEKFNTAMDEHTQRREA